ncbi:NAD(P)/FAD-dependent oxidoreductase [Butyrivibrio sp. MC2013]|uniref:NAD(P)/FAD-dependent oxidoreductase n=1 Tax=Butyrivibrio sp. MC2013 TaxID=1280686 RepID=UPI0003F6416D|nr:NAD(P)/FAD-dependent oxidoreductase [Butyrivibrio sp. MC2013]
MKEIAVIGAGAAGMMAAIAAAAKGAHVTIYEKNDKAGKKIYITGKGRCNVTNVAENSEFFANVCRNPKFLYSSIYSFDHDMVMDFFEQNGCPLKVERGGRVFPVSDHSSDIIAALLRVCKKKGVKIRYNCKVTSVEYTDDAVTGIVIVGKEKASCDSVIVCCGGMSYPSTGSTGDGYRFAREAGHSLNKACPSLVPFEVREKWPLALQGLSLKNVGLKMYKNIAPEVGDKAAKGSKKKKAVYEGFGEMLFTHFGISGPLILSASTAYEEGCEYILHLDLKPALSHEMLDKRIIRDFEDGRRKEFRNVLGGLFPSKLIPVIIELSEINPDKKVSEIDKAERTRLVNITKDLTMTVTGTRGFNEAIITRGGVKVSEIDPSTMESRFRKGLYFAGEVIDTDAVTGGFNLQIAWSTGYLAGISAAERTEYES